ncbi:YgjV family protein [Enterobacter sp. R1(2018)]|uniref:YgjV family protein n=1 Tax=Enterobacter sp. R1(2018) TaxID=2447891 RepID=UPI000EB40D07|nr:YgjV family protein [Enterobacter sp. R1(2018)]RKQ40383.1 YgjV family protein [Enterobacter sp. R1(2018)]
MSAYWIAQGVGVLAFMVGITTFINRDEKRFKLQLAGYSAIIGLHFFLMGASPAGMSAELNALRTLISLRTRSLWVTMIFILLTLGLGLAKFNHLMELLPIVGTVASTWALFRCRGLTTRCVMWCSTACWVTHNFWLGSIGGTLIEGSFLVMNGLTIFRFWRMQRRGIDPFSLEKKVREQKQLPAAVDGEKGG